MAHVLYYVLWFSVHLLTYRRSENAQVFVNSSFTLTNKDVPSTEGLNLNYTWYFETYDGSQLHLSFQNIHLRKYIDFILVGERSNVGVKRQILRWTGKDYFDQLSVLTPGNNLWLTLQSHLPDLDKIFSGSIRVVNSTSPEYEKHCSSGFDCGNGACLTMNDTCNGIINCGNHADELCQENITVNSSSVNFTSINYPNAYPPDYQYTWYFATQEGFQLQLTFQDINTEKTYDHVTVGEGDDASRGQLMSLSGRQNEDVKLIKVVSSGSQMWVRFSSDETTNFGGIAGSVQRINLQDASNTSELECPGAVQVCPRLCLPTPLNCKGYTDCEQNCSRYCNESTTKCSHENTCYSSAQTCDGIPECSLSDDENNCTNHIQVNKYSPFKFRNFEGLMRFTSENGYRLSLSFEVFQRENINHHISIGEGDYPSSHLLDITSDTDIGRMFNVMSVSKALWMNFETKSGFFCSVRAIDQSTAAPNEPPSAPACPADITVTTEMNEFSAIFTPPTCADKWEGVLFSTCSSDPNHFADKGETEVVCSCANSAGLSTNCTFKVSVTREDISNQQTITNSSQPLCSSLCPLPGTGCSNPKN
ncbi:Membrane frizzled-related protein [Holothuria leucospilota]|uniref:Membrane frizzled-related protein n=1 Tax=Holothuria leucospilota TaxID=206669 RepID=A0A9Q1CDK5_HOLLE|nr:Membrane frizzled-related protein [Holothuria leucospilota]